MSAEAGATQTLEITLHGQTLRLDGERAVVSGDSAFVADVHLDKAGRFQREGLAVPTGDDAADLARLARIARRHAVARIFVLGDFVHAAPPADGAAAQAFAAWRERHPHLELHVVAGNHDRGAAALLERWGITWHDGELACDTLRLRHDPVQRRTPATLTLAGHLHPVMYLRDRHRDALRLPVFWYHRGCLVLPSFGRFTGGHPIDREAGDRLWGVMERSVVPIP